jgi:uncharacterized protein (TIGR03067 family)
MRRRFLAIAVLFAFAPSNFAAPIPKGKDPLQGTWELVEFDTGSGRQTEGRIIGRKWTFEGEKLIIQQPGVTTTTTFTFDLTPELKQVDWVVKNGKLCKGIFTIEEDKLIICYNMEKTPDKMAAADGTNLFKFKRVKAEK